MATNKKQAAKPTKSAKAAPSAKPKSPAKKNVATKAAAKAPTVTKKKTVIPAKPAAKKAAPAKKTVKAAPPKKTDNKKTASTNNQKTVNKKNSKPAPAAKKAAPAAKKKEAPKAVVPAKKAAPAKKAVPAKAETKATVSKKAPAPAPAKKVAETASKAEAPKKAAAQAPAKSTATGKASVPVKALPIKSAQPLPKPTPTPAARSLEKKPQVIIAHRKLENKAKAKEETPNIASYMPDTYRSILDEPKQEQGPVYRYSDEELNEFKELITSRLDAARKELVYLQGLITRKDEAGTEDTENRYMNMEDGSGAMEREQLAQLASRQIQFMNHLEKALVRIENKTYGICRVTGKLIDKARLRAVPHATLSIEAKKMMSTKQN